MNLFGICLATGLLLSTFTTNLAKKYPRSLRNAVYAKGKERPVACKESHPTCDQRKGKQSFPPRLFYCNYKKFKKIDKSCRCDEKLGYCIQNVIYKRKRQRRYSFCHWGRPSCARDGLKNRKNNLPKSAHKKSAPKKYRSPSKRQYVSNPKSSGKAVYVETGERPVDCEESPDCYEQNGLESYAPVKFNCEYDRKKFKWIGGCKCDTKLGKCIQEIIYDGKKKQYSYCHFGRPACMGENPVPYVPIEERERIATLYPKSSGKAVYVETGERPVECEESPDCDEQNGLESYAPVKFNCEYDRNKIKWIHGCKCDRKLGKCIQEIIYDGKRKQYSYCHYGRPACMGEDPVPYVPIRERERIASYPKSSGKAVYVETGEKPVDCVESPDCYEHNGLESYAPVKFNCEYDRKKIKWIHGCKCDTKLGKCIQEIIYDGKQKQYSYCHFGRPACMGDPKSSEKAVYVETGERPVDCEESPDCYEHNGLESYAPVKFNCEYDRKKFKWIGGCKCDTKLGKCIQEIIYDGKQKQYSYCHFGRPACMGGR